MLPIAAALVSGKPVAGSTPYPSGKHQNQIRKQIHVETKGWEDSEKHRPLWTNNEDDEAVGYIEELDFKELEVQPQWGAMRTMVTKGEVHPPIKPSDVLVVTTLDGTIYGVHRPTANILWSRQDTWGPLVKVVDHNTVQAASPSATSSPDENDEGDDELYDEGPAVPLPIPAGMEISGSTARFGGADLSGRSGDAEEEEDDGGLYLVEPTGNGDLYYYQPGKAIRKLRLPIKKIVADSNYFTSPKYLATTEKENRVIALDPITGRVIRSYGNGPDEKTIVNEEEGEDFGVDDSSAIFLGRTQYKLLMVDRQTGRPRWNITYGEYAVPVDSLSTEEDVQVANAAGAVLAGLTSKNDPGDMYFDMDEGFLMKDADSGKYLPAKFDSPVISAFRIPSTSPGRAVTLSKAFPRPHVATLPPSNPSPDSQAYIGYQGDTYYILTAQNFPGIVPRLEQGGEHELAPKKGCEALGGVECGVVRVEGNGGVDTGNGSGGVLDPGSGKEIGEVVNEWTSRGGVAAYAGVVSVVAVLIMLVRWFLVRRGRGKIRMKELEGGDGKIATGGEGPVQRPEMQE
ncbi:bifunctional endoribonuclease/protein kinase ire1, partial [Borealophlyctis nickersoniae]